MKTSLRATALTVLLALAACGNTAQDRMLSGAAIGAIGGGLLGGLTTPTPAPDRGWSPEPGHYRRH
jgi:hypothetical protein